MANNLASGRLLRSTATWLWDWVIEHSAAIAVTAGGALMTYIAAVSEALSNYGPVGWGAVGIATVLVLSLAVLLFSFGKKIRVRAAYDALNLEKGSLVNPLDSTFVGKRILLNDFVLPSFPIIDGKTFVDCELVGPACIYLQFGNQINEPKAPRMDAIWLAPRVNFFSGFTFTNCVFRRCAFQRITLLAGLENHPQWSINPHANWIGIPPTEAHVKERAAEIAEKAKLHAPVPAPAAPRAPIEGEARVLPEERDGLA